MGDAPLTSIESSSLHGKFADNASIVLIGARGTGKSSCATIAWSSFGLKKIDVDDVCLQETGRVKWENSTEEPSEHGVPGLKTLLETQAQGCVIVWPPGCVEETGLLLLKQYSKTHPVIHVTRSGGAVQAYLKSSEPTKVYRALELRNRVYRTCSNFEFYNLDEEEVTKSNTSNGDAVTKGGLNLKTSSPQSLRLKRTEQSFVQFVKNVLHPLPHLTQTAGHLPLPPSRARYSYLLPVPLSQVNASDFDVEWLDCGADACQLEIDTLAFHGWQALAAVVDEISRAFAVLTRFFDGPIIYHLPQFPTTSPGLSRCFDLLRHGFRVGVDYATVDLRCNFEQLAKINTQKGYTKLIGCFHDANPGFDGWCKRQRKDMYEKASKLGFEGVKLTQNAITMEENLTASSFVVEAGRLTGRRPFLIAYNTGLLGRPSRCLNRILTPITTAEICYNSRGLTGLESELTIQTAQNALYGMFIYDPMQYYIIGLDVSYSLSPPVHTAVHRFFGMPHSFTRRSMDSLESMKELIRDEHFGGLSIAQGYKLSVLPFVDAMSTHARNIGAINTLVPIRFASFEGIGQPPSDFWANRNRAGPVLGLYGENTDWLGMTMCISRNLSPANVITQKTTALVVGAGGMARAALYALQRMGVRHIVIYNRTPEHAKSLAEHFKFLGLVTGDGLLEPKNSTLKPDNERVQKPMVRVLESLDTEWYNDLAQPTIIISCVPAASVLKQPGANFTLPATWMRSPAGGVVLDLTYQPLVTPLLRQVQQQSRRGWVAVDGLENLAAQASTQFELFTGRKVPQRLMRIEAFKGYLTRHNGDAEGRELIRGKLGQLQGPS